MDSDFGKGSLLYILFIFFVAFWIFWPLPANMENYLTFRNGAGDTVHPAKTSHVWDAPEHVATLLNRAKRRVGEGKNPMFVTNFVEINQNFLLIGGVVLNIFPITNIFFYNIYFLFSVFLTGLFTFILVRDFIGDNVSAFFSSVLSMISGYTVMKYFWGHTNLLVHWIPLIFLLLEKSYRNYKYSVLLGIVLALQCMASTQYTVYFTLIIPLYMLIRQFTGEKDFLSSWKSYAISIISAGVFASIYLFKRISILGDTAVRSFDAIQLVWTMRAPFFVGEFLGGVFHMIDTGWASTLSVLLWWTLISVGCWRIFRTGKRFFPFVAVFVTSAFLGVGRFVRFSPYYFFHLFWPLAKHFRVPKRFAAFTIFSASVIAGFALSEVFDILGIKERRVRMFFVTVLCVLLVVLFRLSFRFVIVPWRA